MVTGERAPHVFSFARRLGEESFVVVVPRLTHILRSATGTSISDPAAWGDTRIVLEDLSGPFVDLFTGRTADPTNSPSAGMNVSGMLADFPVALLHRSS